MKSLVGLYRISEVLHESKHTCIYRGVDPGSGRPLILKAVRASEATSRRRLQNEYRILSRLVHDGIVRLYGLEETEDALLLLFEDTGATPLKAGSVLRDLSLRDVLDIATQIVRALGAVHAAGIIHRNLNPANILWNPDTRVAKLTGFELSMPEDGCADSEVTVSDFSLNYISPEQTGRTSLPLDYRTDFYSFGVTLYEMLTRRLPFEAEDASTIVHAHLASPAAPPFEVDAGIPPVLSRIVMKLLAKSPGERYQRMNGLLLDLLKCRNQIQTQGRISDFEIDAHDVAARLKTTHILYGRANEERRLLAVFDRACSGTAAFVLVAGPAGVGKTALIRHVQIAVEAQGGWFISGKFDQYSRGVPFSAIIAAFDALVAHLLTRTRRELGVLRGVIEAALGGNCAVIVDLLPAFELILGKRPPVEPLGPAETVNRLNRTFRTFLGAICSPEHPLFLFLDDLQWADEASLALMRQMMRDTPALLLAGAYRDNEVDEAHPLSTMVAQMRADGTNLDVVRLESLGEATIVHLISDLLGLSDAKGSAAPQALAGLLLQKTGGNPFFLHQFLIELADKGLIDFDETSAAWAWNIDEIRSSNITDNVVRLMVEKIGRLPERIQRLLKVAAVAGNRFDLARLDVTLVSTTGSELEEILGESLQSGLLVPDSNGYRFIHDRVHQAAHSLLNDAERTEIHWRLAMRLLADPVLAEEYLFELVDHLNKGSGYAEAFSIRDRILRLNLKAGRKAKSAAAYQVAHGYFLFALGMFESGLWARAYDLALDLHVEAAETAYLIGDDATMDRLIASVESYAANVYDKVRVYEVKMQACAARSQFLEGVALGVKVLGLLGVSIPENPGLEDVRAWLSRVELELVGKSAESLLGLPPMTDDRFRAVHRILVRLFTQGFFVRPDLMPIVACEGVLLSLRHGNSEYSSNLYLFYSGNLCSPTIARYEAGARYGELGMALWEKYPLASLRPIALYLYNSHIRPWYRPIRETLSSLKEAHRTGLVVGEFEYAIYAITNRLRFMEIAGVGLAEVLAEIERTIPDVEEVRNEWVLYYTTCIQQAVANLMSDGSSSPWDLDGVYYPRGQVLRYYEESGNRFGFFVHHAQQLMLYYLFGRYEDARREIEAGRPMFYTYLCQPLHGCYFQYYSALTLLASDAPDGETGTRAEIERLVAWMKVCAESAPANYRHKYDILLGEKARLEGRFQDAIASFDRAIGAAVESGYVQDEALACELAGRLLLRAGLPNGARLYLARSRERYLLWGGLAKVRQLEAMYAECLDRTAGGSPAQLGGRDLIFATIDAKSIVKASHAISGELELSGLLGQLLRVMAENAGAERGLFIGVTAETFLVQAEFADGAVGRVLEAIPLESFGAAPVSLIQYVGGVRRPVVFHDLQGDSAYSKDPYVRANRPRSVICLLILTKDRLLGIVYLENNQCPGTFTSERLDVLNLLTRQAAISMENAQLFQRLRKEVRFTDMAVDAQQDTFIVFNPETGRAVRWNKAFREVSEYTDEEIARRLVPGNYLDEDDLKTANMAIAKTLGEGYGNAQIELITRSGKRIPFEYFSSLMHDDDDASPYIIAVGRDITERQRAHAALRESEERLRQAEKMTAIGQLAGGVAHDFNNQLAAIMGYADLLTDRLEEGDLKRHAQNIVVSAQRAADLTQQLLAFSRKGKYLSVPVAVHPLLSEVVMVLERSIDKRVRIVQLLKAGQSVVTGDPSQLQNAILNVALNARDAMPQGGELTFATDVSILDEEYCRKSTYEIAPGPFLLLSITDTGCGMTGEVKAHLFEPFFTTKKPGKGTGMGLASVYGTVRNHHGVIDVYSEVGRGTTVRIYLPLAPEAVAPTPVNADPVPVLSTARILVVDDEAAVLEMAATVLRSLGYIVATFTDGREAVEYYRANMNQVDLVILDMVMPEMGGRDTFLALRRINPHVRALLSSGYSLNGEAQGILNEGVLGFVGKPFRRAELSRSVAEALARK